MVLIPGCEKVSSLRSLGEKLDAEANEELECNFFCVQTLRIRALKIRSFFKRLKAILLLKCTFIVLYCGAVISVLLSHGIVINC